LVSVDYKTGKDDITARSLKLLFTRNQKNLKKAILQVLIYAWLVEGELADKDNISPCIILSKNLLSDKLTREIKVGNKVISYSDYSEFVNNELRILVEEILNKEIAFTATEHKESCQFCDFNDICRRQ